MMSVGAVAIEIDINKLTTVYQGSPDGAIKIIRATDSDDVAGNEPYVISADYSIIAKTENLNSLAGMVNALSNTTIPGIAATVNTLSTDRIPSIEGNVNSLSTELTAVTDSTKFAGKFAGLSTTVQTISNSVTENTDNIAKLQSYANDLSTDGVGIIARLTDKADNAILSATNAKAVTDGLLAAGGQINTLSTDVITANGRIDGLNSKVEGLSSLTNSLTATLNSHNFNIE
jgi:outer membrane murein-binding lipoprotein Lpp